MPLIDYDRIFIKPFDGNPKNAKYATVDIGAGTNGVVTIAYSELGVVGNDYTVEVVAGVGNNVELSAVLTVTDLVVTLGTDGAGALSASKNTALLIAGKIDLLDKFTSTASGTGVTAFTEAIAEVELDGGQLATPIATPCYIKSGTTVYVAEKPVTENTIDGWYSATLTLV